MTTNPNPRTTPRGATRAAQAKAKVDANAARVSKLNAATDDVAAVAAPVKRTTKSAAKTTATKTIKPDADESKITKLAEQLADVDRQLGAKKVSGYERTKITAQRDKLILALIAAGAKFNFIATTRGVPTSTNRGLCRVLQGGKRL